MLKAEKKIIEFIETHIHLFFLAVVLVIGCAMRICCFHFVSHDAGAYLLKWYRKIAEGAGIAKQVGNYNIPYQIIIYILTKLPLNPLTAYKAVSCGFDLALSFLSGLLVWLLSTDRKEEKSVLAFTLVFCSPIVILNSAVWAQCDSIYTFFGIAALLLLYKEKYAASFVMLGASFAFKLQAIFFLPFFLIYYFCKKRFSILYLVIVPVVMVILSLPGLLAGRSIWDIVSVYAGQTHAYDRVYAGFPSFYALLTSNTGNGSYSMFRWFGVLFTVTILAIGLYLCVHRKINFTEKKAFWGLAIWVILSCILFLPNMHERYEYAVEILTILYCFFTPAAIPLAVAVNLLPLSTYGNYLFDYRALPLPVCALINFAVYVCISYWVFCKNSGARSDEDSEEAGIAKSSR